MNLGFQIEAPHGLGSLEASQRYYFAGRTKMSEVLLIWFYRSNSSRWRVAYLHIPTDCFEGELKASPPGLVACKSQFSLPPSIQCLAGLNFDEIGSIKNGQTNHRSHVQFRLEAIQELIVLEAEILNAKNPLKYIAKIGRKQTSHIHPWDLQYWFFCFVLHSRNQWSLKPSTHQNGTWSRSSEKHVHTKFGRPSAGGVRKGWPSAPMSELIAKCYLRYCELGVTMREIHCKSIVDDFGCQILKGKAGKRQIVHPRNEPFPSYGQFRWVVVNKFGLSNVQRSKYGASRMSRTATVDLGNTTGNLANIMEKVEIDAYRCAERPSSRTGDVMPELVVARAICVTTGARVGIGFSLGGEAQEAYRAMLWSMAVDKELVAEAYGIPVKHLDWPMSGMCRALLSDRGPGGQASLIADMESKIAIKSIAQSFTPKAKPNVESSNPRSSDPEGSPTFLQSELQVASMMKQEVLRAASENRSTSILERLSPAMVSDFHSQGLTASPESLWKYLQSRMRTNSIKMTPDDAVRAFLSRCQVSVDRVGAFFNGNHYNSLELKESGQHQLLVRRGVTSITAYTLSMVGRLIWVEVQGRLFKLEAQRRIRFDEDELFVSISQLEDLVRLKTELGARTRESADAARADFFAVAKEVTGQMPGAGHRKAGRPGRAKGAALAEAAVIKAKVGKRAA